MTAAAPDGAALKVPGALRWGLIVIGALAVVLGIVMVLNPFTTAKVLAIIVGIELLLSGMLDLMDHRYGNRWLSIASGAAGVIGGVAIITWPHVTLWVIAVIVGIGFLVRGAMQLAAGLSPEAKATGARGLLVAAGALSTVTGLVALTWPKATIVVLAVLFGIRVLAVGLLEVGAGVLLGKVEVEAVEV